MIEAFLRTPEGEHIYNLVKALDFKILPKQFRQMTRNEIHELLVMWEMKMQEDELLNVRRRR